MIGGKGGKGNEGRGRLDEYEVMSIGEGVL
jgi:hypothetical protein